MYLDLGDCFHGGYESEITEGKIITDFYKAAELLYVTIGNHEFENGKNYLLNKFKSLKNQFVCANVFKKGTEKEFDNTVKTALFTYPGTQIKLGIIGITTAEALATINGDVSYADVSSKFKSIIESKAKELRKNGANAIILLAHSGYLCKNDDQLMRDKLRLTNLNSKPKCDAESELNTIISQLDEGTVDLVLGGHLHNNNHFFINGIPAVTTSDSLHYFSIIYLYFKNNEMDKLKTTIEGPIPICSKVFSNIGRCKDLSPKEKKKSRRPRRLYFPRNGYKF